MIKDLKQTGVHLGKYIIPKGRFMSTRYIDFECHYEQEEGGVIIMSLIASYCLDNNETGETVLKVPCSTNSEFTTYGELTVSDLMSIWKKAVKNLRDECNKTMEEALKDIPYPPNEMIRDSIFGFLDELGS